jgi:hypothetical protein
VSDGDDFFADDVLPEPPPLLEAVDDPDAPQVGQGEIPSDLNRFNVSAFVWGPWWNLAYGLWPRFFVQIALLVVNTVVLGLLSLVYEGWPRSPLELMPQLALGLLGVGVNAWFAATANARLWQNSARRISGATVMALAKSARGTVDAYRKLQKDWALMGLAYVAIVILDVVVSHASTSISLRTAGTLVQSVLTLAVGLVAWFALRRRSA